MLKEAGVPLRLAFSSSSKTSGLIAVSNIVPPLLTMTQPSSDESLYWMGTTQGVVNGKIQPATNFTWDESTSSFVAVDNPAAAVTAILVN
jgi:hypothetical protein